MEIIIRINGQDERLRPGTVTDLVVGKGLVARSLVVEHNGRILNQDEWAKVVLQPGDVLEMLNFVGGG
jgi:thiamine biosynthesis protein ThiS